MNGWEFTAKPVDPYRRQFVAELYGLRWYMSNDGFGLDLTTDTLHNAGFLLQFYREHRRYKPFYLQHEYLGLIQCRFASPVTIPKALPDSGGLIDVFEVTLVHHNPSYE